MLSVEVAKDQDHEWIQAVRFTFLRELILAVRMIEMRSWLLKLFSIMKDKVCHVHVEFRKEALGVSHGLHPHLCTSRMAK